MKKEQNQVLKINAACVLENNMWFFLEDTNALCKADLKNGELSFVSHVPGEELNRGRLYDGILCYKDKIILIPESAKEIAIYDIHLNSFKKIGLKVVKGNELYNPYVKFFSGVVVGSNLYLIPRKYPALIEINLETGQTEYYTDWVEKFKKNISVQDRAFFKEDVVLIDQKLYFCSPSNVYSMEFDIITKETRLIYVGAPTCNVFDLKGYATYLFVNCGKFQNKVEEFECNFPNDFKCGAVNFNKSFDVGQYIYLAPCKANQILAFDKEDRKWTILYCFEKEEKIWKHLSMAENKIYFYDQCNGKLRVLEDGEWVEQIELVNIHQLIIDVYESKIHIEPVYENEHFDLEAMINMVRN